MGIKFLVNEGKKGVLNMKKKNIAKLVGAGAILGGAAIVAGSNYFFKLALSTKANKDKVFGPQEEGLSLSLIHI